MAISFSPSAIIFINTDLVDQVLGVFVRQLYITEVLTASEFDSNVSVNVNYVNNVHADGYRILVLRNLYDFTNRSLADIVLFAKAGLVSVLSNKYGPPGITLSIDRVYLTALINLQLVPPCPKHKGNEYEQGFLGEPTNNSDFDPGHLDKNMNPEPVD